ncbi:MAG: hypothetical protein ACRDHK_11625, partial [Actinomycetota bacterium]
PAADAETLEPKVREALEALVLEETVREGEDGYRLQSPQEKDWEKTRRGRRYERKLWMRDLVKGVAYPPVDH